MNWTLTASCLLALGFGLTCATAADAEVDPKLPNAAELFADQPKGLSDHTIAGKLLYVGEVLGNPVGGARQGMVYEGYAKLGVGLNLERSLGWTGASLYANILYPHGESLTQNYVRDLNVASNIDAYDSARLYKLWFQQNFAEGRYSFRIGQMAADKEFFTCDSASLFVNNAFGTPPVFSQNITGPIYPVSAPGVRLRWEPTPAFSLRTAAFSGDVGTQTANQHQLSLRLKPESGVLLLVEAAYKTRQGSDTTGLPGTFKLGAYYDSKRFEDNLGGTAHHGNYGGYLVADQQVYSEKTTDGSSRGLSVYSRIGFAPQDRNLVDFDTEAGLNYAGLFAARTKDIAGLGFAFTHVSNTGHLPLGQQLSAGHFEALLETTYIAPVTDRFSAQPYLQYIFHPGATVSRPNAIVLGLRVIFNY